MGKNLPGYVIADIKKILSTNLNQHPNLSYMTTLKISISSNQPQPFKFWWYKPKVNRFAFFRFSQTIGLLIIRMIFSCRVVGEEANNSMLEHMKQSWKWFWWKAKILKKNFFPTFEFVTASFFTWKPNSFRLGNCNVPNFCETSFRYFSSLFTGT